MVTGLLLIALIVFVFAQAAVVRGGGQSAADAAALAAAQESRDQLYEDFLDALEEGDDLAEILAGEDFETDAACGEAAPRLAAENRAEVASCAVAESVIGYTVTVTTSDTVGDSVIPGTGDRTATVTATAAIEGRCEATEQGADRTELSCTGDREWSFDPEDEEEIPEARDLFEVHLHN